MKQVEKDILALTAKTIRGLTIDAIEKAGCGHPGLPMGCAEIGAYLYGHAMKHNPADPQWLGRDRFVLSAGHGSMLLYSCLHLTGYDVSLEEVENFRQMGSKTPGHPEYGETPGVETTTGPLGQGLATGAGIALGNKIMAARLGIEDEKLLDGQVFVLAGDGCMMEGITNEAASLAAHLQLDNLVVIYDSNDICLDGETAECFTEDTRARYRALGWATTQIDGHDLDAIDKAVRAARRRKGKPTLIVARTVIGKGAPNKQGTNDAHGAALGEEEAAAARKNLGIPEGELFWVPQEVREYMSARLPKLARAQKRWSKKLEQWAQANPEKGELWKACAAKQLPEDIENQIRNLEIKPGQPGRKASNAVLQKLHDIVPAIVGGSADLSGSDNTMMKAGGIVQAGDYAHRNIKYGVREFCMAAMNSGLALQGMVLPFCGTFMTFSDYMRNAIRLAAMMDLKVVYQFTHDSIRMGEDGPTHIPVEHLAALRAIPNLTVLRPADTNEVKAAWCWILSQNSPAAIILSRQNIADLEETRAAFGPEGLARGAYIVKRESAGRIDTCILATGSEVTVALQAAARLEGRGQSTRVVSLPSFEIFDAQGAEYRDRILGRGVGRYVSIEAQTSFGWHKYIGRDGIAVSIDRFGLSAPGPVLAEHFGFTVEKVLERLA